MRGTTDCYQSCPRDVGLMASLTSNLFCTNAEYLHPSDFAHRTMMVRRSKQ